MSNPKEKLNILTKPPKPFEQLGEFVDTLLSEQPDPEFEKDLKTIRASLKQFPSLISALSRDEEQPRQFQNHSANMIGAGRQIIEESDNHLTKHWRTYVSVFADHETAYLDENGNTQTFPTVELIVTELRTTAIELDALPKDPSPQEVKAALSNLCKFSL